LATVEYDGRPFVGSVRVIATNRMGAGPYFTDRRGRFEAELRPGTYSISLDPTNGTNGGKGALTMIEDPCTFEVRAEQPTAKTLHVLRRTVTLEFDDTQTLDPDAEFELVPVDGRRLAIRGGVAGQAVLFESPPRGAFTVRCAHYPDRPELRGRSWGPFRVECSQADAVFRVPLEQ